MRLNHETVSRCVSQFALLLVAALALQSSLATEPYPAINPTFKDVPYLGEERPQKMDVYLPDNKETKRPAVVVIHGGGWANSKKTWGYPVEFAKRAVPAGYAVFCPDYQLTEFQGNECVRRGGPQNILDCLDAISFVRQHAQEYGVDPDRICAAGDSAGGHLALLAGYGANSETLGQGRLYPKVSARVACIVDFYGIVDFETFPAWGGWHFLPKGNATPEDEKIALYRRFSPVTYLTSNSPATLIVHGRNDPGVTYKQSEELAAKLKELKVPFQLVTLEKTTKHAINFEADEADLTDITLKFLKGNSNSH